MSFLGVSMVFTVRRLSVSLLRGVQKTAKYKSYVNVAYAWVCCVRVFDPHVDRRGPDHAGYGLGEARVGFFNTGVTRQAKIACFFQAELLIRSHQPS